MIYCVFLICFSQATYAPLGELQICQVTCASSSWMLQHLSTTHHSGKGKHSYWVQIAWIKGFYPGQGCTSFEFNPHSEL